MTPDATKAAPGQPINGAAAGGRAKSNTGAGCGKTKHPTHPTHPTDPTHPTNRLTG